MGRRLKERRIEDENERENSKGGVVKGKEGEREDTAGGKEERGREGEKRV